MSEGGNSDLAFSLPLPWKVAQQLSCSFGSFSVRQTEACLEHKRDPNSGDLGSLHVSRLEASMRLKPESLMQLLII